MGPLFSVVIPTHNRATRLEHTLGSLDTQTDGRFEIVVVDDGSTDNTAALLASHPSDRLRWQSQRCSGPWAARNTGIRLATGDWIVFLDDDDDVESDWLQTFAGLLGPHVGVVSCGVVNIDPSNRQIDRQSPEPLGRLFGDVSAIFLAGAFAVRASVLDAAGGYDESMTFGENYELGIRLVRACRDMGLQIEATSSAPLRRLTRPALERSAVQPRRLLDAAEHMLEKHAEALGTDRGARGNTLAIAGVNAARVGEWSRARSHLNRAVAAQPLNAKAWARAFCAWCPPVGRRIWSTV